jgi:hypothetical protein
MSKWYQDSRAVIVGLYGDDADLFCDILAATSPRKQVRANWNLAVRIYNSFKRTGWFNKTGMMKAHWMNVERVLSGEPLQGYKVPAFAANLKGDLERVTIDTWVLYYYKLKQHQIRRKEYYRMEKAIQMLARHRDMRPAEYQAMIWVKAVLSVGKTPYSYADAANGVF